MAEITKSWLERHGVPVSPMCFHCGKPATERKYVDLSNEYSNAPEGIVEFLAFCESTATDRTPVQLVVYVCDECVGAVDYLCDIFNGVSGYSLVDTKPCANPFHDGIGRGVLKSSSGRVDMYGCPDCDCATMSVRVTADESDPAYAAMKHAIERIRS